MGAKYSPFLGRGSVFPVPSFHTGAVIERSTTYENFGYTMGGFIMKLSIRWTHSEKLVFGSLHTHEILFIPPVTNKRIYEALDEFKSSMGCTVVVINFRVLSGYPR